MKKNTKIHFEKQISSKLHNLTYMTCFILKLLKIF